MQKRIQTQAKFLLTCLLRGMTGKKWTLCHMDDVSTHMPLARHDRQPHIQEYQYLVSTHMPLARHDRRALPFLSQKTVSTHMPLARHDGDR